VLFHFSLRIKKCNLSPIPLIFQYPFSFSNSFLEEEIGQALIEGAEKLAFHEHIEQHPIDFLGEKFKEKCVVIAV
jgi:hypothetical protein